MQQFLCIWHLHGARGYIWSITSVYIGDVKSLGVYVDKEQKEMMTRWRSVKDWPWSGNDIVGKDLVQKVILHQVMEIHG